MCVDFSWSIFRALWFFLFFSNDFFLTSSSCTLFVDRLLPNECVNCTHANRINTPILSAYIVSTIFDCRREETKEITKLKQQHTMQFTVSQQERGSCAIYKLNYKTNSAKTSETIQRLNFRVNAKINMLRLLLNSLENFGPLKTKVSALILKLFSCFCFCCSPKTKLFPKHIRKLLQKLLKIAKKLANFNKVISKNCWA